MNTELTEQSAVETETKLENGLKINRLFTKIGVSPFEQITYDVRSSIIRNPDSSVVFKMDNVEVPKFWSQVATDILAQKYLRKAGVPQYSPDGKQLFDKNGNPVLGPENSIKQIVHRIAGCWTHWGTKAKMFATEEDAKAFYDEIAFMLLQQYAAPNSPQWFNTGLHYAYGINGPAQGHYYVDHETGELTKSIDAYSHAQIHACFIQSVKDDLVNEGGIMDLWVREARIFKYGSGSGTNYSNLRGRGESLSGGGHSSGLMSWLKIGDRAAGAIKCVHEDTELITKNGIKKVKEITREDLVLTKNGFKEVANVFDNSHKRLVKVKTALGFEVVCTPEHRFLVRNQDGEEWKEAKEIAAEDFVCIDFSGYEFSEYKKLRTIKLKHHNEKEIKLPLILDEKFGEWLGLIYGDGNVTERKSAAYIGIQIGLEDKDMINKFKMLSGELFGVHLFENKRKDKRDNSVSIRIASKPLIRFLKENDIKKGFSTQLSIPMIIKESPTSVRAAFLRGYFEADGTIEKHIYPACSSTSERLTKDIQLLLQSIGILSTRFCSKHRESAYGSLPLHRLLVTSYFGIKEFAKKIGFISDRKKKIMAESLNILNERYFEQQWILPYFEKDFEEMYNGLTAEKYAVRRATSKYFRETTGKTNFNRFRANRLLNRFGQLQGTFVETLAKSNIYYDRVIVEPFGFGHVFDIEVPDGDQYLINGIITHNSGGTTRRAAKMVILDIDHPDIEEFINWKVEEEKKVAALIAAGYSSEYEGEAYQTVSGQNSNNSVRIPNRFMHSVINDGKWELKWRTNGKICKTLKAKELWNQLCNAAWACADPGIQMDTTINEWHTCPASGRINASNPCSEFMFLDNTACNLASLNLMKFFDKDTLIFDVEAFKHAVRLWTIVLEISVLMAQFPTKEMADLSYRTRSLGLGYSNIGTLLMVSGIPYDSDKARSIVGAITALMTGQAYATSSEMAKYFGPFKEFEANRKHMLRVIRNHRRSVYNAEPDTYEGLGVIPTSIDPELCPRYLLKAANDIWDKALKMGEDYGYRNAQVTLLAPTGTISLLMDCDTTGIEPEFGLVKFKKLAGGGYFKIINQSVIYALRNLGYNEEQIKDIVKYMSGTNTLKFAPHINTTSLREKGLRDEDLENIEKHLPSVFDINSAFTVWTLGEETMKRLGVPAEKYNSPAFNMLKYLGFNDKQIDEANNYICGTMTIEGAPHLKEEHYPIFDCANKCGKKGKRFLHHMAHIKIMAASQPFLSGSISKTINMPNEATVDDVKDTYMESWKLGLKSIAIYRDGSKLSQPLAAKLEQAKKETEHTPVRKKLPDERRSITHKFQIANQEGYITVGLYDDNRPGEIFITMNKEGSVVAGLMDSFATSISIALQYGVPLKVLASKFVHTRFEPSGITNNPEIRMAKSISDYIFKWLALKFLSEEDLDSLGIKKAENGNGNGVHKDFSKPQPDQMTLSIFEFDKKKKENRELNSDAPACHICGGLMVRSGSCYVCLNCGANSGCS